MQLCNRFISPVYRVKVLIFVVLLFIISYILPICVFFMYVTFRNSFNVVRTRKFTINNENDCCLCPQPLIAPDICLLKREGLHAIMRATE